MDMSLFDQYTLAVICVFTSMMTAAIGLGGGIILLVIMPNFMPYFSAIPIHGVVQFASNFSRFLFSFREAKLKYAILYIPGALLGAAVGSFFVGKIPETYLPVVLGVFIIVSLWTDIIRRLGRLFSSMLTLGFIQTFLSLFIGSTGVISLPTLIKNGLTKNEVIVTHAMMMSILNTAKVAGFVAVGFAFMEYLNLTIMMVIGSVIGSFLGAKVRHLIPEKQGKFILKAITTVLAIKLIVGVFFGI